jgi:hypothetical protein
VLGLGLANALVVARFVQVVAVVVVVLGARY